MADRPRKRYTTYLVAFRSDRRAAAPVYATMAPGPVGALAAVAALVDGAGEPTVVGSLSTRTAKALRLKPGEVRAV